MRLAVALLVGGFLYRVLRLQTHWLNPDEGRHYTLAHFQEWSAFWSDIAANAHPPLFYLSLRGLAVLGDDPFLLRIPALVFGSLAVLLFYEVTRRIAGEGAGWLGAGLAALAPGLVVQSQIVRPYTMLVALLLAGLWLLLLYHERPRPRVLVAAAVVFLLASLTHYGAVLVLGSLALVLAGAATLRRLELREASLLGATLVPGIAAFALLYAVHLLPYFVRSEAPMWLGMAGFRVAYAHLLHESVGDLWSGFVGVHDYVFGPRLGPLAAVFFLAGCASLLGQRRWLGPALAAAVLALGSALSLFQQYPFGASRHSLYLAVVLVPGVAAGVRAALAPPPWRAVAAGVVTVVALAMPELARRATLAPPLRITPEQVTLVEVARPYAELLTSSREDSRVVVMDKQTFFMFTPFVRLPYPDEIRDAPETVGEVRVGHVDWGASDILVSSAWVFSLDARSVRKPRHLRGFLARAHARHPELELTRRGEGVLIFGGWNAPHYAELGREGPRRGLGCLHGYRQRGGLGSARIDFASCLGDVPGSGGAP